MSRGRKPNSKINSLNWEEIFWENLPIYIRCINSYFDANDIDFIEVGDCLEKLTFNIPKGLNSKEIKSQGNYPVISQSKEFIIGYNDNENLLIKTDLPLVIFGDHSKTIKFIDQPFVIGADGVKLLKPKNIFDEKFFYYFLHGIITDTKDYGRHYSLLRKGVVAKVENKAIQKFVVEFLDDLKNNSISNERIYFNKGVEIKIITLHENQITGNILSSELTHQLSLVKKLRQQLLQDAVQGKLVKQNPKDESASELLKKIKAERSKIKKANQLEPINYNKILYDVPDNWIWCRLGNIVQMTRGKFSIRPRNDPSYFGGEYPFIQIGSLDEKGSVVNEAPQMLNEKGIRVSKKFPKNTIAIAIVGGTIGNLGVLGREMYFTDSIIGIIPSSFYNQDFILNFLRYKQPEIKAEAYQMAGQPNIKIPTLENLILPLPPLDEQIRIVKKLDQLMSICDELEASIKQSAAQNEKLLQQVLREALRK
ncbi:MAG: restriction endonuclease subunit S [Bacteroidota bacterium]|nr:restriction endonuclease subunit S [Bacteroidota bacterium]